MTLHPKSLEQSIPSHPHLPQPSLKWHESAIVRAALLATLTLGAGYTVSAILTLTGISATLRLAHDPSIEDSLSAYLITLKDQDALKRALLNELLLERLKEAPLPTKGPLTPDAAAEWWAQWSRDSAPPPFQLLDSFAEPTFSPFVAEDHGPKDPSGSTLPSKGAPPLETPEIQWLDRDHLRLRNIKLTFPKRNEYEVFKQVEDLRQRYQMIGARLEQTIQPSLYRVTMLTLVVTFFVLISLLVLLAKRFQAKLNTVMRGFSEWSLANATFRFGPHYGGELGLITRQFNAMADEVELNRQRSLYLEKIASWQTIARKLAHEIKNPLTPIQMLVSQLRRRYSGEDPQFLALLDEAHAMISQEIGALRRMVDDFAQFARLPEPRLSPVNLTLLCRRVVEMQAAVFPRHSLRFETDQGDIHTKVDADLLRQVLINLIKNGVEASLDRKASLELRLTQDPLHVWITVTDDGPGIPAENLKKIFEAYFTTKHTGPSAGMGLGLAICQKIIMDHRGQLRVDSRPGLTSFTIELPH